MKIKLLAFPFIFLLFILNSCKKDKLTSKPEGLYEVVTFSYGPNYWETCQRRDTIEISTTRSGVIVEDRKLELDMSRSTDNSHHFRKEQSDIQAYSLTYYPDCDSISYSFDETWTIYGNGYRGRKLGTPPCVPPPSITNCSETSTNQICINEQTYELEYGAIIPSHNSQTASIYLWSNIPLNADSSHVTSEYGNVLRFSIPFTSMDNLAKTYSFSDSSLRGGSFYVNSDFNASEEPSTYYYFDKGVLNIEWQNNEYVFTFDLGHCVKVRGTGYFDGLFFEW